MTRKCIQCGKGTLKKVKTEYVSHGISLGRYDALQCTCCKARYYESKVIGAMQEAEKKAGIFGLEAKTRISEVGHNYAVRLPKRMSDFLNIKKGTEASINVENKHRIVITV